MDPAPRSNTWGVVATFSNPGPGEGNHLRFRSCFHYCVRPSGPERRRMGATQRDRGHVPPRRDVIGSTDRRSRTKRRRVRSQEAAVKIKIMTIHVDDQEKALRFYSEMLGFKKK